MKYILTLFIIASALFYFISCGNKSETKEPTAQTPVSEETTTAKPDFSKGQEIYRTKCIVCHQENGQGIANQFPPLANSDYLLADKKRAVEQVLNGSNKQITVNGIKYTMPMPPQVETHEEAVEVVNYILNTWGNNEGIVTLEEVKDIQIIRENK